MREEAKKALALTLADLTSNLDQRVLATRAERDRLQEHCKDCGDPKCVQKLHVATLARDVVSRKAKVLNAGVEALLDDMEEASASEVLDILPGTVRRRHEERGTVQDPDGGEPVH